MPQNKNSKIKVLIAEDEGPVALGLQNKLETLGYEVPSVAMSGEEAVWMASSLKPDVVLMDIRLQGQMDGIDAAEKIHSHCRLPVIYLTAYSDQETLQRARKTEPYGYLLKPLRDRDLQACVEMAMYKHQAEQEQRTSERRYAATLQSIGDALIVVDQAGCITLMNAVAAQLTGWPGAEAVGRPLGEVFRIIHEQTRQPLPSPVDLALQQGAKVAMESQALLLNRDGREIPIADCAALIQDPPEGVLGAVLVFRDVSESKRAEEMLRKQVSEIADLYNHAPCGYHSLDAEDTFVRINDTELEWLGYRREELLGRKKFADLLTPVSLQQYLDHFPVLQDRGMLRDREYELVRKDGTVFPVLVSASAVRDEQGRLVMSRATVYDMTERKHLENERRQLEAQRQQTQKFESLGVMASGMAHDFNNLLTGILGYADLARLELAPGSAANTYLEQIVSGSRRLADLTHQLLAFAGKGTFATQPINLSDLVEGMSDLLKFTIDKKCALHFCLAKDLPLLNGDQAKIRQAVMNLVLNASEASAEGGGNIVVTTDSRFCDRAFLSTCHMAESLGEGQYVFFAVVDGGCGMTAETSAKIFDPFFSTKFVGRGLGLATVLGIVRSHSGAIKVDSEPGRGTTVTILFPACSAPATLTLQEEEA